MVGRNKVRGMDKRIIALLTLFMVGMTAAAWQPGTNQVICDPATGCATSTQSSRPKKATRTPVPMPVASATTTSTMTPTATSAPTGTSIPTVTASPTAGPAPAVAPVPPPASNACAQCGPSWPLIGGGAFLLIALGGLLFYLISRRPLSLLPAIQDVFPDGRQNNTVTLPDGGMETNTINVRDGDVDNFTVTFHDAGGFENTIGGKDINDLSGNGMS